MAKELEEQFDVGDFVVLNKKGRISYNPDSFPAEVLEILSKPITQSQLLRLKSLTTNEVFAFSSQYLKSHPNNHRIFEEWFNE